jgi:hypothetical protein
MSYSSAADVMLRQRYGAGTNTPVKDTRMSDKRTSGWGAKCCKKEEKATFGMYDGLSDAVANDMIGHPEDLFGFDEDDEYGFDEDDDFGFDEDDEYGISRAELFGLDEDDDFEEEMLEIDFEEDDDEDFGAFWHKKEKRAEIKEERAERKRGRGEKRAQRTEARAAKLREKASRSKAKFSWTRPNLENRIRQVRAQIAKAQMLGDTKRIQRLTRKLSSLSTATHERGYGAFWHKKEKRAEISAAKAELKRARGHEKAAERTEARAEKLRERIESESDYAPIPGLESGMAQSGIRGMRIRQRSVSDLKARLAKARQQGNRRRINKLKNEFQRRGIKVPPRRRQMRRMRKGLYGGISRTDLFGANAAAAIILEPTAAEKFAAQDVARSLTNKGFPPLQEQPISTPDGTMIMGPAVRNGIKFDLNDYNFTLVKQKFGVKVKTREVMMRGLPVYQITFSS